MHANTRATQDPTYAKRWRLDHARNTPRQIDPTATRKHLEELMAAGFTVRGIGAVTGISPASVSRLARGTYVTVRRSTATKILAVQPAMLLDRPDQAGLVPAVGTRRRIRALLAIGWRHQDLTPRLGYQSGVALSRPGTMIEQWKHSAAVRVYDELWSTPGPSEVARARAARAGHAPPLAWDEDTLDDPDAVPHDCVRRGEQVDLDDVAELVMVWKMTTAELCNRLGLRRDTLRAAIRRAGRADIADALNENNIREGLVSTPLTTRRRRRRTAAA